MRFLSEKDYKELANNIPYYQINNRWPYFESVINTIKHYGDFDKVLEIGPAYRPLVKGCDTMDTTDLMGGVTYQRDAKNMPWPIKDKQYDLVIALQVWEHLLNRQIEVFSELKRVARHAIMSFPLNWQCRQPDNCSNIHCGISEITIKSWVHFIKPVDKVEVIDNYGARHSRLIYFLNLNII